MNKCPFSQLDFRLAVGCYPTGINVVTALIEGQLVGFTCQSFFSLSLSPPLVTFSVMKSSSSWPQIRTATSFAINVLSDDQAEVSARFSQKAIDRWNGITWRKSDLGNPVIDDVMVCLDCHLHLENEVGDHWLIVADVKGLNPGVNNGNRRPLLYYQGSYRKMAPPEIE